MTETASSALVAENLATAEHAAPLAPNQHVATTFEESHAAPHAEPTALGLDAGAWVALSMLVVIAILLWKKVPAMVGGMLDNRIAGIRRQLDEATALRAEAEALRAEYVAKGAAAEAEAEAIRSHAVTEAEALVVQAQRDADALIERRAKMAEDRIGAAERAAIAAVRAKAASAAAAAAAILIEEGHDAAADKALVDKTIARLN